MNSRTDFRREFRARLKEARLSAGLSQAHLAEHLGLTRETYAKYETRSLLPHEFLPQVSKLTGQDLHFFLPSNPAVNGPARPTAKYSPPRSLLAVSVPIEVADDLPDAEYVEMLEVEPAAGGGSIIEDAPVIGRVAFRRDWLKQHGLLARQCVLIRVRGESMQPTLPDQCNILVALHRQRRRAGGIFVVRTDNGLVVKRASKDSGRWELVSDHPAYSPMEWADDDELIGEVVWMARTFTPGRSPNSTPSPG